MGETEGRRLLEWGSTHVRGRRVRYGVAGEGQPVVFLHGWALGSRAYKRGLRRIAAAGARVYAPALPGFGGSAGLGAAGRHLGGYADWLGGFLDAMGVDEPVVVAGHSLGGAVGAAFGHRFPGRVGHLVLINSIGSPVWSDAGGKVRTMVERPLHGWVVDFSRDLLTTPGLYPTVRSALEDVVPNLLGNPAGLLRAAGLARAADVRAELHGLAAVGVPVTAVSSQGDLVVPAASFRSLCRAAGVTGEWVPGRHSWMLGDPDRFAEVIVDALGSVRQGAPAAGLRLAANE